MSITAHTHTHTHTYISHCIRHLYFQICTPRHNFTTVSHIHTLLSPHLHTQAQLYNCITHTHTHTHTLVSPRLHTQIQLYNCITHTCISPSSHPGTTLQLYHTPISAHPDTNLGISDASRISNCVMQCS